MTNELFTEVSAEQQEMISGGLVIPMTSLRGFGLNISLTNFKGLQLTSGAQSQSTAEGSGTLSQGDSAVVETSGGTGNVTGVNQDGSEFSINLSSFFAGLAPLTPPAA